MQVHQLGQVDAGDEGAQDAATEAWGDESDSESTETETDSGSTETTDSESTDSTETESTETDTGTETTESMDTETDGSEDTGGPVPEPCEIVDLGGTEGITVEFAPMNDWADGACRYVYLTNESTENLVWTRDLRFGGEMNNCWNTEFEELSPTDWSFAGTAAASNVVVLEGQTIQFGCCMACMPDE